MARMAFYAPLKSPNHPVPSGEREMARNLMKAIAMGREDKVTLVSELRSHVADGDDTAQSQIFGAAEAEISRLSETLSDEPPALWVTYHNYYKAPDLIGPRVSAALGIPYVIVEASRARSRLTGPWARFAAAAEAASNAASAIFYVTALDLITLSRDQTDTQDLVHLRPFLPSETLPDETHRTPGRILSVGMFRGRDKLESYRIIADTLGQLSHRNWQLDIAGDGPARADVEALFAPFEDKVHFLGQLDREALLQAYRSAAIFLWPGFNEAYGMVYLEAQATGLPVVAQDRDGVRDVLAPGRYPAPEDGPNALAAMLEDLLQAPDRAAIAGATARRHISNHHLIGTASKTFWNAASKLIGPSS